MGFILKADSVYFMTYIKGDLDWTRDRNYAWFTKDRKVAEQMAQDLRDKQQGVWDVVEFEHA